MSFQINPSPRSISFTFYGVHGAICCGQKSLMLVAVPAAPVRVPSQRQFVPSDASVTSVANDKGDDEMIPGAVHRSPGLCLTTEENARKPQLGDRLMKGLCDQLLLQMGPLTTK